MGYRLRPEISFCVTQGRAIFLDLAHDRYLALPTRANEAFVKFVSGQLEPAGHAALQPLVDRGILRSAEDAAPPAAASARAPRASLAIDGVRSSAVEVAATIVWQAASIAQVRIVPLLALVERVRRRKASVAASGSRAFDGEHVAIVAAAWRAERFFSSSNRCLPRSLALMRRLLARGCAVDLMFGIRATPFAAHCWLQHADTVLDDTLDHARLFTPILVI